MQAAGYSIPTFHRLGKAYSLAAPGLFVDQQRVAAAVGGSSFTLEDSDGTTVINARAVTVTDGIAYVALVAGDASTYTLPQDRAWREYWTITDVDGTVWEIEREFYVGRRFPRPLVTQGDLEALQPAWRELKPAGIPTLDDPITVGWGDVVRKLITRGILASRLLDDTTIFGLHRARAAWRYAKGLSETAGAHWKEIAADYLTEFNDLWNELVAKIDADDDGVAESDSAEALETELFATAIPRRSLEVW